MSTHEIQARALQMPLHERAHLAKFLLASLDSLPPESGDDDEIERAWAEEVEKKVRGSRFRPSPAHSRREGVC